MTGSSGFLGCFGTVTCFQRLRPFPVLVCYATEGECPLLAVEAGDAREGGPDIFRCDAAERWHTAVRAPLHFLLELVEVAPAARD